MHVYLLLLGVILLALIVNLPLGYFRQGCDKFTFAWYFYVHISIPAIIYLRIKFGYSWKVIPLTLGAAVVGQLLGGRLNHRREQRG